MKKEGIFLDLGTGWLPGPSDLALSVYVTTTEARGWWHPPAQQPKYEHRYWWDVLGRTDKHAPPEAAKALIRAAQEELRRQE